MTRWHALDRLRALAVVLMVQGHTTTALMRSDALPRGLDRLHSLIHGLTAPAFLFGAGLAFGVTSYDRYASYQRPGPARSKRFWRYLTLLAIGYALQLPGASLWAAFHVEGEKLALVCRVGPLQLIALTLGLCQLGMLVLPSARVHAWVSGALGVGIAALATSVASSGVAPRLGAFVGAFVDDRSGSQFPIFPWASFVFLGVAAAFALRRGTARTKAALLVGSGLSLALLCYFAFYYRLVPYEREWFWRTAPTYLLFRLGSIVALLGLLSRESDVAKNSSSGPSAMLARHSLVAYIVHLLVLYGTPLTPNLAHRWGPSLSLGAAGLACCLMLSLTVAVVYAWDWLSRARLWKQRVRRVGWATVCLVVLVLR